MTIKVGEIGKVFNYGTFFDLSINTDLELKFTSPTGVETILSAPRVTAPAIEVTDSELGTFPASTYMQITTIATDFTESGEWSVCGTYIDASPKLYFGNSATFTIEPAC